jgi:hypothetical protein
MTLSEIKAAVLDGKPVRWMHSGYVVLVDSLGQWMIMYTANRSCIGLTWMDGTTMNGKPHEFYIEGYQYVNRHRREAEAHQQGG